MIMSNVFIIGEILRHNQLSLKSINEFCLVMIPVWNSWNLMDRMSNLFGAANFTFKTFTWIYHIMVVTMGVNAQNCFEPNPQGNTASIFVSAYFLTQALCFIFSFSVIAFSK